VAARAEDGLDLIMNGKKSLGLSGPVGRFVRTIPLRKNKHETFLLV
jgi:hypothetical protein